MTNWVSIKVGDKKMRRFAIKRVIPFIFLISFTSLASGQTPLPLIGTEYGVGVRAMGMGSAFVGLANDYSASFWNPAGLDPICKFPL